LAKEFQIQFVSLDLVPASKKYFIGAIAIW